MLPSAPLRLRFGQAGVWTGRLLLVWGGLGYGPISRITGAGPGFAEGAGYDPATRRWRRMAAGPLSARTGVTAVWSGRTAIFWGGEQPGVPAPHYLGDGAAYDPVTDRWQRIAPAPLSPRSHAWSVWTGSRMIVFGGATSPGYGVADGASYDPVTNSWQKLPQLPHPVAGQLVGTSAGWTGTHLLVWATYQLTAPASGTVRVRQTGATWTPGAAGWSPLPAPPAGVFTLGATTVWTGQQLLVAHGHRCTPAMNCLTPGTAAVNSYDPGTGLWRALPNNIVATDGDPLVWTGSTLIAINGVGQSGGPNGPTLALGDAVAYDFAHGRWDNLPPSPVHPLAGATAVWTGHQLLIWGAWSRTGHNLGDTLTPAT